MNTACYSPAVVSTSDGDYLIVIGGYDGGRWTATVELFQVKNRRWHKLTDLPQPLPYPSATICGDQLNVIEVMTMATHVPFKLYHPVTDQSHHLSPSPGNLSLVYQ